MQARHEADAHLNLIEAVRVFDFIVAACKHTVSWLNDTLVTEENETMVYGS